MKCAHLKIGRWLRWTLAPALALLGAGYAPATARSQQAAAGAGPLAAPPYHIDKTWRLGGEGGWDYLTVDSEAHRLYVARQTRVQVVDTEKGDLVGEVPGLDGAHGVALVPEFNRGFATSGKTGTVVIFDLKTLKAIGAPVTAGTKPDAVIYDPLSKHIFAFNGGSGDASVIDAASGATVATVALGGAPESAAVDGAGKIFVNLEDKSEVLGIDTRTNAVVSRWALAPGEGPAGLALDVAGHRLFAGCRNQQMVVLDAVSGKSLANLPIGKGVDACAFDSGTGFAFASNGDGTLTLIQEGGKEAAGFQVIDNVKTQKGARTMALDVKTHAVYLATADFEPAPPPAAGEKPQRPKILAGSFVILRLVR